MSCGDYQNLGTGYAFYSSWGSSDTSGGPFYLLSYAPSYTHGFLGFALRKYTSNADCDHWIKETLRWKRYVRYMDDMVFIANSKKELWDILVAVRTMLKKRFRLTLNRKTRVFKASQGIDFCGYRIFYDHMLPRKRNVKAARIRFRNLSRKYREGKITLKDVDSRVQSFLGYMKHCDGRRTTCTTLKYLVLTKGE